MASAAFEYLRNELLSGRNELSEDGRAALDALSFLYGSEEAATRVVLGDSV